MMPGPGGRRPPRDSRGWLGVLLCGAVLTLWTTAAVPPDTARQTEYAQSGARPLLPRTRSQLADYRREALAAMQDVMGPLPDSSRRVPLDARIVRVDTLARFTRTTLSFAAEPGDRPLACLLVPKGLRHRVPAVLCLHEVTPLGMKEAAGIAGSTDMDYAAELAERGFVTLCLDYPNYGDYHCDPAALGYASTTMKGIWNRIRAVDLLQSLPYVDPNRIGSIGHSLGGHNALFHAVFDPRVKAVVSSCGFTSLRRYDSGNLRAWSRPEYMPRIEERYRNDAARLPFGFTDVLALIAPRPVLVLAARQDGIFDFAGVRDCVAGAWTVYRLLGAEDRLSTLYFDGLHHFPEPVRRIAYQWLERQLKG
jgi:dienelactone hydrolase